MTIRSSFAAGGMAAALALTGVTAATLGTTWVQAFLLPQEAWLVAVAAGLAMVLGRG